jgi:hypothetical protein
MEIKKGSIYQVPIVFEILGYSAVVQALQVHSCPHCCVEADFMDGTQCQSLSSVGAPRLQVCRNACALHPDNLLLCWCAARTVRGNLQSAKFPTAQLFLSVKYLD